MMVSLLLNKIIHAGDNGSKVDHRRWRDWDVDLTNGESVILPKAVVDRPQAAEVHAALNLLLELRQLR